MCWQTHSFLRIENLNFVSGQYIGGVPENVVVSCASAGAQRQQDALRGRVGAVAPEPAHAQWDRRLPARAVAASARQPAGHLRREWAGGGWGPCLLFKSGRGREGCCWWMPGNVWEIRKHYEIYTNYVRNHNVFLCENNFFELSRKNNNIRKLFLMLVNAVSCKNHLIP